MKSYLNAKLILFREILDKKTKIIIDEEIPTFTKIKKIAVEKKLMILK